MPQEFVILDVRPWTTVKAGGGVSSGSLVIYKDVAGVSHSMYLDKQTPSETDITTAIRNSHLPNAALIGKTIKV